MGKSIFGLRKKGINNPFILEVGIVKYLRVQMKCPKSNFPFGIIVYPIDCKSS